MPGPYAFKQIFAADPSNTSNVAKGGSILLFAPGDASRKPLVLTDLANGMVLPNPVPINSNGFGPAFLHETLPQVAWEGGGFSGTFESFEGLRADAVAAVAASQASAQAAGDARVAAEAAVGSAATGAAGALAGAVAGAIAGAFAEVSAARNAAQQAAGLVGAPSGDAVLAAIQPGGAAHAALSGAIGAAERNRYRAAAKLVSRFPVVIGEGLNRIVANTAAVPGATELREQDDVIWDPAAPDLIAHPEREFKFYFTAVINGISHVYVALSADGDTFLPPVPCAMGPTNRSSEDPSATQTLSPRGEMYRDADGLMYLYVEDKFTSTTYVYSSKDGISFNPLPSNPAIPKGASGTWDGYLTGSPIARHDGTRFLICYEGVEGTNTSTTTGIDGVAGPIESMGLSCGETPNALTKSANNPVWRAENEPLIGTSLVVDSFFYNDEQSEFIFTAHNGKIGQLPNWTTLRGRTTNLDPLTWQDGDIRGFAGSVDHNYLFDFTVDHSYKDASRFISQHGGGGGFTSRTLSRVPASYGVPLAIWLDASAETAYTNNQVLTTLTDQSGKGRNAIASGSPTFVASAVGGKPAYRFGVGGPSRADSPAINVPVPTTVFVVAHLDGQQYIFDSVTGQRAAFGNNVINPGQVGFFNGVAASYASAAQTVPTGWHIWVIHTAGGGFNNVIYRDGVPFATAPGAATSWTDLRLGQSQDGLPGIVDIAEIGITATALTLDRVNQVGASLAEKYGLTWTQVPA